MREVRALALGVTGPVMSLGLLTVYGLGELLPWRWLAAASALLPLLVSVSTW